MRRFFIYIRNNYFQNSGRVQVLGDILLSGCQDENYVIEILTYMRHPQESGLRPQRKAEVLVRNAKALQKAGQHVEVFVNRPRSSNFYQ